MRFFSSKLRFSLRSLFLATFVLALLLQGRLSALQYQRDHRRSVVRADIREQVIAAERIEPVYRSRMLAYVERRITESADSALFSRSEQRELLQLVQSANARMTVVQVSATPPMSALASRTEEWPEAHPEACPW
jgi:hypothetical protein